VRFDPETRTTRFALTLVEGRKRQIRRMMSALGHPVVRLVRIRMGPLELGRLVSGKARPLRARERRVLKRALLGSRGKEQAGGN
jgi:pseudouridine synthase